MLWRWSGSAIITPHVFVQTSSKNRWSSQKKIRHIHDLQVRPYRQFTFGGVCKEIVWRLLGKSWLLFQVSPYKGVSVWSSYPSFAYLYRKFKSWCQGAMTVVNKLLDSQENSLVIYTLQLWIRCYDSGHWKRGDFRLETGYIKSEFDHRAYCTVLQISCIGNVELVSARRVGALATQ